MKTSHFQIPTRSRTEVQKLKTGTEVKRENGWIDTLYGIRPLHRSNGQYLVFVEEDAKEKIIMYNLPK